MRTTRAAMFAAVLLLGCGGSDSEAASGDPSATSGDEDVKVTEPDTQVEVVGPGGEPASLPNSPDQ